MIFAFRHDPGPKAKSAVCAVSSPRTGRPGTAHLHSVCMVSKMGNECRLTTQNQPFLIMRMNVCFRPKADMRLSGSTPTPLMTATGCRDECRNQGLYGSIGAGLHVHYAPALAEHIAGQAFHCLAFAYAPCRTLDAERRHAPPLVRLEIEIARFHRDAPRSRGSCCDCRHRQSGSGDRAGIADCSKKTHRAPSESAAFARPAP